MRNILKRVFRRATIETAGPYVEAFSIFLSLLAVTLVVIDTYAIRELPADRLVYWQQFAHWTQFGIWAFSASVFTLYMGTHERPRDYLTAHWAELVVCVTWAIFLREPLALPDIVSVQMFVLVGTTAHVIRVATYLTHRYKGHETLGQSVIATASLIIVLCVGTTAMMIIERETFTNFFDTGYSVFMQMMTVGGDLRPTTHAGQVAFGLITLLGKGVIEAFVIVVVISFFSRKLAGEHALEERLLRAVEKNTRVVEEANRLKREEQELARKHAEAVLSSKSPPGKREDGTDEG